MSHLVIAGTGRAGTTYLVRWLRDRGQDVGRGGIDKRSGSGWEHDLRLPNLPYVVKDPWLWRYCAEVDPALVRALVLPVRDLYDAAASRVRIQRQATGQYYGDVPGGMLSDADVGRQADILACGFHHLIAWAVGNDVPVRFVDFDRLNDDEYLAAQLEEFML